MKNLLIRKTKIPVYKSSLWIIICPSIVQAIDHIEDQIDASICKEVDKPYQQAYAYSFKDGDGTKKFFLFLKPKAKPGEIAHEVKHLVNHIFSWHNVRLSTVNDEPECYYLETLVDQTHNAINQYKRLYCKSKPSNQEVLIQTSI